MHPDKEPPFNAPVLIRNSDLRPPMVGFVHHEHAGDCPALLLSDCSVLLFTGSAPFSVGLGLVEAALDNVELLDAALLKEVIDHLQTLLVRCGRLMDEGKVRPTSFPGRMQ